MPDEDENIFDEGIIPDDDSEIEDEDEY